MSNVVLLFVGKPLIRELVGKVLTDAGCSVVACDTFGHLVSAVRTHPGAVAVADFWGESHAVLYDDERAEIVLLAARSPTILLAAGAWAAKASAGALGLVALLRKPFDLDELCQLVARTFAEVTPATTD